MKLKGLALERFHLIKRINETNQTIDKAQQQFLKNGGCPCCFWASQGGADGKLSKLNDKNLRRIERLKNIEAKLRRAKNK